MFMFVCIRYILLFQCWTVRNLGHFPLGKPAATVMLPSLNQLLTYVEFLHGFARATFFHCRGFCNACTPVAQSLGFLSVTEERVSARSSIQTHNLPILNPLPQPHPLPHTTSLTHFAFGLKICIV